MLNCLSEAFLLDTDVKLRCSLDKVLNVTGKECITNTSCVKSQYVIYGHLCLKKCPSHLFALNSTCVVSCPLVDGFAPSMQKDYTSVCVACEEG